MSYINKIEKQSIHTLFETKNYLKLYEIQTAAINTMLMIDERSDFEDFLSSENSLAEDVFWLYYSAVHGESLLIGGYEEDVTEKVADFLKQKLPERIFSTIREYLQNLYVDIDGEDNLKENIEICNQRLEDTGYLIHLDSEDIYCTWAYFLSVTHMEH